MVGRALVLAGLIAVALASPSASQERDRTVTSDSLRRAQPIYGYTDTTEVITKPLTLREIIARSVEGEKRKLGGHNDMTYTMTVRLVANWEERKEIRDVVSRMYADVTGFSRAVMLGETVRNYKLEEGEWVVDEKKGDEKSGVRVESDGYSDFAELPFFLEEQKEFDFELLERTIEVDHVIFKIGFKPKSDFKALPSGIVYVDTDDYRIIHEEFTFEQNPFPLFLKDIRRISRHWEELPGGEWVFTRLIMEVELRGGFFGKIPDRAAVSLFRDDFRFDEGYDARTFGER
ncbi:MAG: hypothetical protein JSW67_08685 [Candidatus Latescibacterota bacterium]|nr:MAG: hypothetical protein JSW67_08685 [Candidatus Latescibacterota bacterium]